MIYTLSSPQVDSKEWSGQTVKARVKDASGEVNVRLLGPPAANGAAPSAPPGHN